jgi:hypothetical protein
VRDIDPESIHTRDQLSAYLSHLRREYEARGREWENQTLGDFLGAMKAWLDDMDGYYSNRGQPVPDQPSWALLAQLLAAARIYE